jgi:hypothetical protein
MSTKGKIEEALRSAIQDGLGSDSGVDIAFATDPSNDNLIIAISGLTLDESGEVILSRQEFEFSATVTLSITGTVSAADEDTADDMVADWLGDLDIRVSGTRWRLDDDRIAMDDWSVEDTEVRHIL